MDSKVGNQWQDTPSTPVAFCLVKLDLIFFSQGRVEGGPTGGWGCGECIMPIGSPLLDCRRKILNLAPLKRLKWPFRGS